MNEENRFFNGPTSALWDRSFTKIAPNLCHKIKSYTNQIHGVDLICMLVGTNPLKKNRDIEEM